MPLPHQAGARDCGYLYSRAVQPSRRYFEHARRTTTGHVISNLHTKNAAACRLQRLHISGCSLEHLLHTPLIIDLRKHHAQRVSSQPVRSSKLQGAPPTELVILG